MRITSLLAAACLIWPVALSAAEPSAQPVPVTPVDKSFIEALTGGTPWIDVRYRYETVSQEGLPHHAHANTIRTHLGYKTGVYQDFLMGVELENVSVLGDEAYNNTFNGKTTHPVVADPRNAISLNQFYLGWQGLPGTNLTLGRQFINLDNQRHVGTVAWRQNDQVFDAVTITNKSIPQTELFYSHVFFVNRVFGPRTSAGTWDTDINLINASYKPFDWLKVVGYTYLLDIDEAPASSSATFGARLEGKYGFADGWSVLYSGEYARQVEHGNNPRDIGLNYYLVEPGISWKPLTGKVGYEVLTGNGTSAFQTPLATLHAFNGWVDKFLTTPGNGLTDFYLSAAYKVGGVASWLDGTTLQLIWHDYNSDRGDLHYGDEWNFQVSQTLFDHYTVGFKYGDYNADTFLTDTHKGVVTVQVKY